MSALFSSVLYVVSNPVHLINVLYILHIGIFLLGVYFFRCFM